MEREYRTEKMINLFKKFPGIGQRQAERFAHFVARSDQHYIQQLTDTITALRAISKQCPQCLILHQHNSNKCQVCAQNHTDTIVIVEKDADVAILSSSIGDTLQGYYFVLNGLIPIADEHQKNTRIPQLINSIKTHKPTEIVIAFSAHPDADHTARYIADALQKQFPDTTVSTLGRGLSSGSELEYSDPETLIHAFTRRTPKNSKK